MSRAFVAAAVILIAQTTFGIAHAKERLTPSWMKVDAAARKVEMEVVAGYNANNSSWNYNGYHDGDMTVVVPMGWSVRIDFTNHDGDVPHSEVIIADPGKDNLPQEAGHQQAAFPRAYSKSPQQGISAGDKDTISFKADEAGKYLWYCGVPGHGLSGMWVRFKVSADADKPYITIAEGAEQGRN